MTFRESADGFEVETFNDAQRRRGTFPRDYPTGRERGTERGVYPEGRDRFRTSSGSSIAPGRPSSAGSMRARALLQSSTSHLRVFSFNYNGAEPPPRSSATAIEVGSNKEPLRRVLALRFPLETSPSPWGLLPARPVITSPPPRERFWISSLIQTLILELPRLSRRVSREPPRRIANNPPEGVNRHPLIGWPRGRKRERVSST